MHYIEQLVANHGTNSAAAAGDDVSKEGGGNWTRSSDTVGERDAGYLGEVAGGGVWNQTTKAVVIRDRGQSELQGVYTEI